MARIYSTNFCDQGPTVSEPTIVSYEAVTGQTVILRDMTFTTSHNMALDNGAPALTVSCGIAFALVWELWQPNLDNGRTYMWEGREVLNGVGILIATIRQAGCTFRANGYVLI